MATKLELKTEIDAIGWADICRAKGSPGKNPKDALKLCLDIWENTQKNPHPFILIGPDQLRKNQDLVDRYGLVTRSLKKRVCTGAMLGELQWSTLINDIFILVSAQAQKDVRLYWKVRSITLGDLIQGKNLTSTAREIAILKLMGYRRIQTDEGEKFALFTPPETITELSLSTMWKALQKVEASGLLNFIQTVQD